jgi:hypothetical protein
MLGVGVGVCLYSLPKLPSVFHAHMSNVRRKTKPTAPGKTAPSPSVQRPMYAQVAEPMGVPSPKHIHPLTRKASERRSQAQPKPESEKVAEPAAAKVVAVENVSLAPPPPATFKPIGYVEKAGGQLEAIILQENEVQVVHMGDLISGRYRVTKMSPDSVEATDETLVQAPMAKPNGTESKELTASVAPQPSTPPVAVAPAQPTTPSGAQAVSENRIVPPPAPEPLANSLGYVQKADGKIETVVADEDTVRLVPETPRVTMAQVAPSHPHGEASPQDSTMPTAAVSSTREAVADNSVHPAGVLANPPASVIRPASYEVPLHDFVAADNSAPNRAGMGSVREPVRTTEVANGLTASPLTENPAGSTDRPSQVPVWMKPIGYVVRDNGEFDAILSDDDDVYVVRQGDRFAGRYRALSVSADAVVAMEDPPRQAQPPPFALTPEIPDLLSAVLPREPSLSSGEECLGCKPNELGEVSEKEADNHPIEAAIWAPGNRKVEQARAPATIWPRPRSALISKRAAVLPEPATFAFQTLGYVETQDGEMRAIVAEGSEIYLVKQGETFADQYRATSVDSTLVLAVRVSPGQDVENFLFAQTESGGKPASKDLYGHWHFPLSELAYVQALHLAGEPGGPVLTDPGMNLLNSSLPGFDLQSHFLMADNPSGGF